MARVGRDKSCPSPRRGAVMAYTCSLLRTLPAIDEELEPEAPQFILDNAPLMEPSK